MNKNKKIRNKNKERGEEETKIKRHNFLQELILLSFFFAPATLINIFLIL